MKKWERIGERERGLRLMGVKVKRDFCTSDKHLSHLVPTVKPFKRHQFHFGYVATFCLYRGIYLNIIVFFFYFINVSGKWKTVKYLIETKSTGLTKLLPRGEMFYML